MGGNAFTVIPIAGGRSNQSLEVVQQHWKKTGDLASYAKFTTNPSNSSYSNFRAFSDGSFTDASFIRLQNLSVAYKLPEKLIKKTGLGNLRIYLQGQNLLIITKYKGIDPEVQNFGGLPLARIITAGVSCNF